MLDAKIVKIVKVNKHIYHSDLISELFKDIKTHVNVKYIHFENLKGYRSVEQSF